MKILNKGEPIIDPCGTSNLGSNDFPNDEKFLSDEKFLMRNFLSL